MVNAPGKKELAKENSKHNWVYNAQLHSEEFKILTIKSVKESCVDSHKVDICRYLDEESDWSLKARKYLSIEQKNNKTTLSTSIAAKLAVSEADAEKKLITAIELAKNGYIICSLRAILDIIANEKLDRDDRLDACIVVIENIAKADHEANEKLNLEEGHQEWLFNLHLNHQLVKITSTILELYNNQEGLKNLSCKFKELISSTEGGKTCKMSKQEKIFLDFADKRNLIIRELSKSHLKPIIRSVHHLACTGGTLMCKCLASMPDVALISEVNPMNRYSGSKFDPTNPLLLLEKTYRDFTTKERIDSFKIQISHAFELCQKDDVDLILRDHSHTDFYCGEKISESLPIRDYLSDVYDLISIVTVRHPLDSYLGLIANGWDKQFAPNNLNEYSRRYLAFLDKYSSLEIIRYEDFCENPQKVMEELCDILKIGYNKEFINTYGSHELSGDSGRKGLKTIEKRPRRAIPAEVEHEIKQSQHYIQLIQRLRY